MRTKITETAPETIELILATISSWKQQDPSRLEIESVKSKLGLLWSQLQPREGFQPSSVQKRNTIPICSIPGCSNWKQGMVNQALPGFDPVWFCREHEPDYQANGVSKPPGSAIDKKLLVEKSKISIRQWTHFLTVLEGEL